ELWGRSLPSKMQSDPPGWSIKYPEEIVERWLPAVSQGGQTAERYAESIARAAEDMRAEAASPEALREIIVPELTQRLNTIIEQMRPYMEVDKAFHDRLIRIARDPSDLLHDQVVQTIQPLLTAYY